jgi:tetrahydromethanopterin S-methyltransferase subunit A
MSDRSQTTLDVARGQLKAAIAAAKCHACGCLHGTLAALAGTSVGRGELATVIAEARAILQPIKYDCLGCPICYPALASNAVAEALPEAAEHVATCPTDVPGKRQGWPPLAGDYQVIRYRAPVAVCTLNSDDLALRLAREASEPLAIVGTLHTENLGIERIIRNVIANPNVRFLVLCGQDTRQAVGHLPGRSLESLFAKGIDERGRIRGALGRRPVLKNVTAEQVRVFLEQVQPVTLIGEDRDDVILQRVADAAMQSPGAFDAPCTTPGVEAVRAKDPARLVSDPAGFFVVYPDPGRQRLVAEHYSNDGVLDCVIEGATPAAVYTEIIERKLISRLDHAAYLGRELAHAERATRTGERYVQDRAPGEPLHDEANCGCSEGAMCSVDQERRGPASQR